MHRIGLCPILWLLLELSAWAQDISSAWVQASTPEARQTIRSLGLGFVEQQDGDWYLVHGHSGSLLELEQNGIQWRPGPQPMASSPTDGYPDARAMREALQDLADENPDLVALVSLGESREGRSILGLRISATSQPALEWRILGAHHGDELSSAALALSTAQALVVGYASIPKLASFLDRDAVWIVPHVNPDGVDRQWRYNSTGVDLNRNYEYQWSASTWASGTEPFSEPETRAIRSLGDWTAPGAGLSMHSGAINLGWPWNYQTEATPDGPLLEALALDYAENCTVDGFWTTNGASWYITQGDTNDWSYGRHGILDYTLEVSETKTPPVSELDEILSGHLGAVLAFMTKPHALAGQVVDAQTGQGIPSSLRIDSAPDLHTRPNGRFGRPVLEGSFQVEALAPGYTSQTQTFTDAQTGITISMERDQLSVIRPSPALLSQSGDGHFSLETEASEIWVSRPGYPSHEVWPEGDGWSVSLDQLSPGPWTLEVDGWVSPRSLFIGERDARVQVLAVGLQDDSLLVDGKGFEVGSQAWVLAGTARAPVALDLIYEDSTLLQFSALNIPQEDPIDLLVVSHGYQLSVLDILGDAITDTGEPTLDTGQMDSQASGRDSGSGPSPTLVPSGELTGCGCSYREMNFPRSLLVVSLGLLLLSWRRTP